jgi:hypothetical protein
MCSSGWKAAEGGLMTLNCSQCLSVQSVPHHKWHCQCLHCYQLFVVRFKDFKLLWVAHQVESKDRVRNHHCITPVDLSTGPRYESWSQTVCGGLYSSQQLRYPQGGFLSIVYNSYLIIINRVNMSFVDSQFYDCLHQPTLDLFCFHRSVGYVAIGHARFEYYM